jgi:hypothetical protein
MFSQSARVVNSWTAVERGAQRKAARYEYS